MEFAMTTIVVDEYDRAIEYYTKVLGFTLTEDTALSPEKRWVTVRPGDLGGSILFIGCSLCEQNRSSMIAGANCDPTFFGGQGSIFS